jgi:hypothetical protein
MRLSEQYTVERSQYDPAFRTINLRGSKNCGGRVVDLNADAIAAIESLKVPGQCMKGRAAHSRSPGRKVSGKRTSTTRSRFNPSLELAKIEGLSWHGNCHTFCSWLAPEQLPGANMHQNIRQRSLT